MRLRSANRTAIVSALGLVAGVLACPAQTDRGSLERQVADLKIRVRALEQGIAEANRAEKEAAEQLGRVRRRLEALGTDLLDGGDDRHVEAIADLQVLDERLDRVADSASRFAAAVTEYLRQAVAADPDARLRVETAMRELDEALGLRQKRAPSDRNTGSASRGSVLSIDRESGLLVLNIGDKQGVRIGTTYRLVRGNQPYGTAIIADVRRPICGAFVESLEPGQGPVRVGDTAILETE
jgi:hypothetical protein